MVGVAAHSLTTSLIFGREWIKNPISACLTSLDVSGDDGFELTFAPVFSNLGLPDMESEEVKAYISRASPCNAPRSGNLQDTQDNPNIFLVLMEEVG